jgi:fused signal recognition particle receptor
MSFAGRVKDFFNLKTSLADDFFDGLCDLLVEGDFGGAPAMKLVERLEQIAKKEKITDPAQLKEKFAQLLEDGLLAANPDGQLGIGLNNAGGSPGAGIKVILLLGVNGVGKTTTAAKLACRYLGLGKKPILAAADTFRAGAVNQLKIHGDKIKTRVVAHQQGGDPAAVVYDALEAAMAGGGDLIIADTAGRMHTKAALVEELRKIGRVLENKLGNNGDSGPVRCIKWLVLDATTGRNALAQAGTFHEAVELDGVILTKYDSSAKGGIVFSLASELKLPAVFLCDGEKYENIRVFDKAEFAREFAS